MSVRDTPESKRRHGAAWRSRNRQLLRDKALAVRRSFRNQAFEYYGRSCCRCGFDDERALQIDHVADNGADERKALGGQQFSGWIFYRWLKKQGWPSGYQTLCANCNAIKQVEKNERIRGLVARRSVVSRDDAGSNPVGSATSCV